MPLGVALALDHPLRTALVVGVLVCFVDAFIRLMALPPASGAFAVSTVPFARVTQHSIAHRFDQALESFFVG